MPPSPAAARRAAFAGGPSSEVLQSQHETGTTDGGMHAGRGPLAARRSLLCGWNLGTAAMRAGGPGATL